MRIAPCFEQGVNRYNQSTLPAHFSGLLRIKKIGLVPAKIGCLGNLDHPCERGCQTHGLFADFWKKFMKIEFVNLLYANLRF